MRSGLVLLATWLASFDSVLAHYRWIHLIANGSSTADYYYVRENTNNNSPVTDVNSTDIRCNTGTQASAASTHIGTVAAGSVVGLGLDQAIYHAGVTTLYMTKVTDANTADGSTPWFKVAQLPPTFATNTVNWPSIGLTSYNFTIPKSLPSGEYLLRAEDIALHVASTSAGAQFYISCAQLTVTGGGSGTPSPTVSFPGAYKATDPGILINIYDPVPTSYTFPGPAVWKGGSLAPVEALK